MNENIEFNLKLILKDNRYLSLNSISNIIKLFENLLKVCASVVSSDSQYLKINFISSSFKNGILDFILLFSIFNKDTLFESSCLDISFLKKISNKECDDIFNLFQKFLGKLPKHIDMNQKDMVEMLFSHDGDRVYCNKDVYKLYINKEFQNILKNFCKTLEKERVKLLYLRDSKDDFFFIDEAKIDIAKSIIITLEEVRIERYSKIKLKIKKIDFPYSEEEENIWGFHSETFDIIFNAIIIDKLFIKRIKEGESFALQEYLICNIKKETAKRGKKEISKFYIEKVLHHIKKDFQLSLFLDL